MSDVVSAAALRAALLALPEGMSHGAAPAHIYLPPSHVKALNPDVQLVTGMRGAGKTFWWSVLQDGAVRQLVGRAVKWPPLNENTEVRAGLGSGQAPDEYPDRDHLRHLMEDFKAAAIWRTVLAWQFALHKDHPLRECDSWAARTRYVAKNPEAVGRLFQECDAEFDERGVYFLVLFDALDRFSHDWKAMYRAIHGLLRTARELLSYKRLRVKVFLPSEQADSTAIAGFADESGVVPSVNLNWPRRDLYGLLWHHLGNGPEGKAMRGFLGGGDRPVAGPDEQCAFSVPRELVRDENRQRETFHRIAGSSMGPNHRRGVPYAWVTDHLADAERRVSPVRFSRPCARPPATPRSGIRSMPTPCTTTASGAVCSRARRSASRRSSKTTRGWLMRWQRLRGCPFLWSQKRSRHAGGVRASLRICAYWQSRTT